ncbi:MAG: hypothetical protein B7Y39_04010 [Bdellovibrio sp. 28-41-41]|nr:MAG: hypothetical protein B7Y39_04010 [Bdellovibrio sp. 28-41-41]
MLDKFDAFVVAKELYKKCKSLKLPRNLKDQLLRASSSVALNLAEGSGKHTPEDQRRFYSISFGSLRECQAIFAIEEIDDQDLKILTDRLGAMLFKLSRKLYDGKPNGNSDAKRRTAADN